MKLRLFTYVLYLLIVILFAVEISLRFGLIESQAYKIDKAIAEIGEEPPVLILGDSFSVDREGSLARLLREYLAIEGCITVNLAG